MTRAADRLNSDENMFTTFSNMNYILWFLFRSYNLSPFTFRNMKAVFNVQLLISV